MRLSVSSPQFRILFAVPFLGAMLAFSAFAEANPRTTARDDPSASQAQPSIDDAMPAEEGAVDDSEAPIDDSKVEGTEPSPGTAAEAPKSSVVINIDKSTQEMTVFVDGIEQHRWSVSTGSRGYSTPSGEYTVSSMNKIWYSKQWDNAPMPHAVFFTKKGHAIHGTTEVKRLGNPASHGCVRLAPKNAETLFYLVKETGMENAQVILTGTTPGGEGPNVASTGSRKRQAYPPPWFEPGDGFYAQPGQRNKKRRGLFGRRWFQPGTQGYYAPAPRYQPRGVGPRY
jgi:lipoprotein-anchoring transpeptidase ErfK/SrfK